MASARTHTLSLVALVAVSLSGLARAQPTSSGAPPASAPDPHAAPEPATDDAPESTMIVAAAAAPARDRGDLLIAVKFGGVFPQAFSRLNSSYLVQLEVGWALPVLKHRLAITVEGGFTAPEADGGQLDPRVPGGVYNWHLEQREVIVGLTLVYRHPIGRLTPYVGIGPRLYILDSRVSGSAGSAPIASTREQSTTGGAGIPVGLGVRIGPGDLVLEVALNVAPLAHTVTGNTTTGSLSLALGYRFIF